MNQQRLKQLIAAYGGDAKRWPESERVAALNLYASNPELAMLRNQQASLDQALDAHSVITQSRVTDVMARLANRDKCAQISRLSLWDRASRWLVPDTLTAAWRPALAAASSLVLGISLGVLNPDEVGDWSSPEQDVFMPYIADANNTAYGVVDDWSDDYE